MKRLLLPSAILFIIATGIIWYFIKKNTITAPEFIGIKSIELLEIKEEKANASSILIFHNPNKMEAQLINTQIKVYSEDVYVASVSQTGLTHIQAEKDFEVPFQFEFDMLKFGMSKGLSGLIGQALSNEKQIPLRFEGYCRVKVADEVFKIPVNYEETLRFN